MKELNCVAQRQQCMFWMWLQWNFSNHVIFIIPYQGAQIIFEIH